MKNFKTNAVIFITICLLACLADNCSAQYKPLKLTPKGNVYQTSISYENGDGSKAVVKFFFNKEAYKNFKITRAELAQALNVACVWAKYEVKNTYSWRFSNEENYILFKDNEVSMAIKGSAENGYGSRGSVSVIVVFNQGNYKEPTLIGAN